MRYSQQPLQSFRLRNFKAVRDSGVVKFTPLTVFIGNNGSGKSSLIEGMETLQSVVHDGLDEAMNRWRGFEQILNRAPHRNLVAQHQILAWSHPMEFRLRGLHASIKYSAAMEINRTDDDNIFIQREEIKIYERNLETEVYVRNTHGNIESRWAPDILHSLDGADSALGFLNLPIKWQFINLNPDVMAEPRAAKRTAGKVILNKDGSNIADYLNDILDYDPVALEGIISTLRYVLPYAKDIQTALTSELGRQRYLQLSEKDFKIPGWLLSTGTLRVLALLAVLRHPSPPPLLCIEEIENGLDPRTMNLLVDEIRRATESGRTQVICTTHSPYFLDLVPLSSVVVVERDDSGQPKFTRPDEKELGQWAVKYAPGQLYAMSQLTGRR